MIRKLLSVVMVILVLSTGCSSNPPASPPSGGQQKESKPQAATNEQAKPAAPQSQPASGTASGTLISATSTFGEDALDPLLSGAANQQALIYPMFEQLGADDGKGHLVPRLAESWSISSDRKSWTIKLRKGIKFHNGDDFTSADVKFSLERLTSQKSKSAVATVVRPLIDRIETPDPSTVVIYTKDPTVTFIDLLNGPGGAVMMPKKYIDEKGEAYFADHPVGTGPFKFVKHEPGVSVEFEALKDHWRVTPAFQKLVIKLVPEESTRLAMLKNGEADIVDISVDGTDAVKAAGFEIRTLGYDNVPAIYLPGTWLKTDQPTMDAKVRQALSLAINREEIAKTFFKGYASTDSRVKMTSASFGWDPTWKPDAYDPQKAKALLAEAGYPSKFKDPVIVMYSYPVAGANWMPQFIQIISGYWEAVGVKTKITPIDFAVVRSMYLARPVDPKLVGAIYPQNEAAQANPLTSIVNAFGSKGVAPLQQDTSWDELYSKTISEPDEAKRIELTRQLTSKAYDQYVAIMTVAVKQVFGVSKQVGEWRVPLSGMGATYESIQRK